MLQLYGNIGNAYLTLENDKQAEIYFTKGEAICRELNDSLQLSYPLIGLGNINLRQQNYETALKQAELALHIVSTQPALIRDKLYAVQLLARIYEGTGDYVKALEYAQTALEYAESINSSLNICWTLETISSIYLKQGRYSESEALAFRALATDSSDIFTNVKLFEYIARANIMLENKEKANIYMTKVIALTYESSNINYQSALSEMEVKYETEKKELKISSLEKEKRTQRWLGVAIATALLLTLGLLFYRHRLNVNKRRLAEQQIKQLQQEQQLIATQSVLDGETQERTRLARDLHDGLGSMLTGVKFSLNDMKQGVTLEAIDVERFDNILNMMDESIRELRRVAHNMMPESLRRYGLKAALTDFCNSFPLINMSYYGDESRIDSNLEVMIYRIIHELINNAMKHSGASKILVQVVQEIDRIAITIEDNGCGFEPSDEAKGMGLQNIRTRVAAYNGNLMLDSKVGTGTEVNVELRIEN
jgi:signal transduction histidine kinase